MRYHGGIRIRHGVALWVFTCALVGCASPYRVSEKTTAMVAKMDRNTAIGIVRRGIVESDRQGGLCREMFTNGLMVHTVGTVIPGSVSMTDTRIGYRGSIEVPGGSSVSGNVVRATFVGVSTPFTVDLTQLQQITVTTKGNCVYNFGAHTSAVSVWLTVSPSRIHHHAVEVNVVPEQLDEFVAAVKYLSPNAVVQ